MAKSNLSQQQQSIKTPFMITPLVDIFGNLAEDKVAQAVISSTFRALADTLKYVLEFLDTLVMTHGYQVGISSFTDRILSINAVWRAIIKRGI